MSQSSDYGSTKASAARRPFGVVDIGSNSVRLVIFDRLGRNPWPLFNEKVVCGIGRGMVSSGALSEEGTARALEALARFRTLAEGMNVATLKVVATAAVRDAVNGDDFALEAEAAIGTPLWVLTGEEEARLAANGVLFGMPDANGIVGDLGGGSLEVKQVSLGALGEGATFPLGPLRLMDAAGGKMKAAQEVVTKQLAKAEWLSDAKGKTLYLVGGSWRNFSSILMEQDDHPLRILQHYTYSADKARALAALLKQASPAALKQTKGLSSRRVETIPYGALVLERLIKACGVKRIVTSAYGVREGILYEALEAEEQTADPLFAAAADLNVQLSRSPGHAPELQRWLAPLWEGQKQPLVRYQQVICYLSDIGWRYHPDYRAERAFERVLTMPVAGLTHEARAFLALSMAARYGADVSDTSFKLARRMLKEEDVESARALGLALRLAYQISGAVAGLLPHCTLARKKKVLVLTFDSSQGPLAGEIVEKRFQSLANALGLEPQINFD
jgi:exopolyphosphatase/guanosine-5'-triphosphate,3'-diphosphate pyrophosphatase